nr:MAG TPA: hypothetical protein [Caudoviricetes sp.]
MSDFARKNVRDVKEGASLPFKRQGDFIYDSKKIGVKLADDKVHVLAQKANVDKDISDIDKKFPAVYEAIHEVEAKIPYVTNLVTTNTEQNITALKSFGSEAQQVRLKPDGTLVVTQEGAESDTYKKIEITPENIKVASYSRTKDKKVRHATYDENGVQRDIDRGNTAFDIASGWIEPDTYCYIKNSVFVLSITGARPQADLTKTEGVITLATIPKYITSLLMHDLTFVFTNHGEGNPCYPGRLDITTGNVQVYASSISTETLLCTTVAIPTAI